MKAWFAAHPTPDTWAAPTDRLMGLLELNYKQDGANSFSEADFREWMDHLKWIRLGLACPQVIAKPEDLQTFIALGEDETISHLAVEKMVPRDVKGAVLQNLIHLAQANMADLHEYAALGVAYAVVFDEPFPADWPHPQVAQSAVPIGDLDIAKRFAWYVEANRNHKTALDLTQLGVDDLKHLVDSEVKLSELQYGQENGIPYDHFEDIFPSIHYVESRVRPDKMIFNWPMPTYTLKDIFDNGGICVDQAYYSSEVGKGRGIPTIYFQGQGTDGGHAWFGYLTSSGKWDLDCGRYINQNYPKGYALDPQTWQEVNDVTLENLAKGGTDPRYQPAQVALAWARLHEGQPSYGALLEAARTVMPELAEAWEEEGNYLDKSNASADDKKTFYQNWITQFNSYADMKVEGQQRLLAVLKASGDADADGVQQDIVLQNRSEGIDLGVQGSMNEIEDKFKAQDWDGAKLKFETAVRDFKDQGGGTFFYNLIQPYVLMCIQYGQVDQANDGIDFTEERMGMDQGSIIQMAFEQLKETVKSLHDALPTLNDWLGKLDNGDYAGAWDGLATPLKTDLPSDKFVESMQHSRDRFGKVSSRTLAKPPMPGDSLTSKDGKSVKGHFIQLEYADTFENGMKAKETLMISQEDSGWKTLDYTIRKDDGPSAAGP